MARKFRLEVGAQGLQALITVLETDAEDKEIISYVLEALCYICAPGQIFTIPELEFLVLRPFLLIYYQNQGFLGWGGGAQGI